MSVFCLKYTPSLPEFQLPDSNLKNYLPLRNKSILQKKAERLFFHINAAAESVVIYKSFATIVQKEPRKNEYQREIYEKRPPKFNFTKNAVNCNVTK